MKPPAIARRLLSLAARAEDRAEIVAGLDDEFMCMAQAGVDARPWYWRQVRRSIMPLLRSRLSRASSGLRALTLDGGSALRQVRRRPRVFVVAGLILSMGLGLAVAVFSVADAVFFKPAPFPDAASLVYVYARAQNGNGSPLVGAAAQFVRERGKDLADWASYAQTQLLMGPAGANEFVSGEIVSGAFFELLGVPPAMGRAIGPGDTGPGASPVVVISDELWTTRFGRSPNVLGTRVRISAIDGFQEHEVIGVAPRRFHGISDPLEPSQFWIADQRVLSAGVLIARLRPGVAFAQFTAMTESAGPVVDQLIKTQSLPGLTFRYSPNTTFRLAAFHANDVRVPSNPTSGVLPPAITTGLVLITAMVMLLTIVNVTGLILADVALRMPEMATLAALGAGRIRLVMPSALWGMSLAAVASAGSLVVGSTIIRLFASTTPLNFGRDLVIDTRVTLFAMVAAAVVGTTVSAIPAWHVSRRITLGAFGQGVGLTMPTRRLRWIVLAPQVVISVALAMVAAGYVKGLKNLEVRDDLAAETFVARITFPRLSGGVIPPLADNARQIAARLTDVRQVATAETMPFRGYESSLVIDITREGDAEKVRVVRSPISGDYFTLMRQNILQGRALDTLDSKGGSSVAVISASLGQLLWPGQNALGRRFVVPGNGRRNVVDRVIEVVGVAADSRPVLGGQIKPAFYELAQDMKSSTGTSAVYLLFRAARESSRLEERLRKAVADEVPDAVLVSFKSMAQTHAELLYPRRVATAVAVSAAIVSQLLSAIALYSLFAYMVTARMREYAVRSCLGASPDALRNRIVRDAVTIVGYGLIAGVPLAFGASVVIARMVRGAAVLDLIGLLTVAAVTIAAAWVASFVPARRAANADPSALLRQV